MRSLFDSAKNHSIAYSNQELRHLKRVADIEERLNSDLKRHQVMNLIAKECGYDCWENLPKSGEEVGDSSFKEIEEGYCIIGMPLPGNYLRACNAPVCRVVKTFLSTIAARKIFPNCVLAELEVGDSERHDDGVYYKLWSLSNPGERHDEFMLKITDYRLKLIKNEETLRFMD